MRPVEHARGEDPEFAAARRLDQHHGRDARSAPANRNASSSCRSPTSLRTPLTSIRGYADAIVDGATDQPADAANVISWEARRLERLVQDLLDLARLDADRFSLDLVQRRRGTTAVRQVVDGFRHSAGELGSNWWRPPAPRPPSGCRADADRLVQVLANLVGERLLLCPHPGGRRFGGRRGGARPSGWSMTGRASPPSSSNAGLRTPLRLGPGERAAQRVRASGSPSSPSWSPPWVAPSRRESPSSRARDEDRRAAARSGDPGGRGRRAGAAGHRDPAHS